jgi:ribosomal-protein-alanine N-acetyltransferase
MLELNFSPFPTLSTERLELRAITLDDAAAIVRLRSDERVMRFIGKPRTYTMDQATELIERVTKDHSENTSISWAITRKGSHELIGMIGFYRLKVEHHRGELGFALHADHWRQGIMGEAIEAVVACGFEQFKFHGIEAITDAENIASNELLRSCGFKREGLLKENYLWNGHFRDSAIWCMLAAK